MRPKTKYLILLTQLLLLFLLVLRIKCLIQYFSQKKSDYNTNINEIENKIFTDHYHDKFITTQEFNTFKTSENFASRLAKTNLASKSDIANFVKETDFNNKLKNLNKNVILNKTKYLLGENKLNELSKKFKSISTKGLPQDLMNQYKILSGTIYFSSVVFQNDLVFTPAKKH